jgi:hypothetical protein
MKFAHALIPVFIFAVLIGVFVVSDSTVNAAIVNGEISISGIFDSNNDCGATISPDFYFWTRLTNVYTNDADMIYMGLGPPVPGTPLDWYWTVIFDAYGNPISGTPVRQNTGYFWPTSVLNTAYMMPFVTGWRSPQARPFIAKVFDTDSTNYDPNYIWDVVRFPVIAVSQPFDPIPQSPACAALPIGDPYNFIVSPPDYDELPENVIYTTCRPPQVKSRSMKIATKTAILRSIFTASMILDRVIIYSA